MPSEPEATETEAPGRTDLMVAPGEIDRFVEANPPPYAAEREAALVAERGRV